VKLDLRDRNGNLCREEVCDCRRGDAKFLAAFLPVQNRRSKTPFDAGARPPTVICRKTFRQAEVFVRGQAPHEANGTAPRARPRVLLHLHHQARWQSCLGPAVFVGKQVEGPNTSRAERYAMGNVRDQ